MLGVFLALVAALGIAARWQCIATYLNVSQSKSTGSQGADGGCCDSSAFICRI
jgi:hypothetical protein